MKMNVKKILPALLVMGVFLISGCVEHRYYRAHHSHSPEWNRRHHHEPKVEVDIRN